MRRTHVVRSVSPLDAGDMEHKLIFFGLPRRLPRRRFPFGTSQAPHWSQADQRYRIGVLLRPTGSSQNKKCLDNPMDLPSPGGQLGYTLFDSISYDNGNGGWYVNANYSDNQAVVNGFLSQLVSNLATIDSIDATIGTYGSQDLEYGEILDGLTGGTWTPSKPIVVWLAIEYSGTCSEIENAYCPMPTIGGYFPMIWQYAEGPDYDLTPYNYGPVDLRWKHTSPPGIC